MDALNLLFVNLREAITTWLAGFLPMWAADALVHFGVGIILVLMALMSVFMRGAIVKQTLEDMERFKEFAESA